MTPRMLIAEWTDIFRRSGIPDPETDASVLLSSVTQRPPLNLRLDSDSVLDDISLERFRTLADRRLSREPLQYILNETFFCGLSFYVDSRVLIPRPETELLCEWAESILAWYESPVLLDLCCGSGCLGITLKRRRPDASVFCSDISQDAIHVAEMNAARLHADVHFLKGDLFAPVGQRRFHLIVSNPPYIPGTACLSLQPEVMCEPASALNGGPDGLNFYRRICREASGHLLTGGTLLMELGDDESGDVRDMMHDAGFTDVEIRSDYQSLPRMISGMMI